MLQRVYGTAFADKVAATALTLREAKRRDTETRQARSFPVNDDAAPASNLSPQGRDADDHQDFMKAEHLRRGYDIVIGR
jgi:hypothetical protein